MMKNPYIYIVLAFSGAILLMSIVMNATILLSGRPYTSALGMSATLLTLIGILGVSTGCALKTMARQLD